VNTGFDRKNLRFKSVRGRTSRVSREQLVGWCTEAGAVGFADSLPDVLTVRGLRTLAAALVDARSTGASRVLMYGGHVIKCGLGPMLARWIENGRLDSLATNGAGTIHDLEMALFGETSEDVEAGLADGSFGMWEETGRLWARAVEMAFEEEIGLGAALGMLVLEEGGDPSMSPLAAAFRSGRPVTVHPALGSDIVHPHPDLDWGKLGTVCERDFDLLGIRVAGLTGGVVINAGSAVILPEVFLKLLTCARNLGFDVTGFTAASFDMMRPYRPLNNVIGRPVRALGGTSVEITGSHEVMLPLLDLFIDAEDSRRET
jgi:hypothetical protein